MKINSILKTGILLLLFLLNVCRLSGQVWNSLGNGTTSNIYSFGEYNGKLLVGCIGPIGGIGNGLATWDGSSWDSVGCGTTYGKVRCFATYNNELIVGGDFQKIGTSSINTWVPNTRCIAAWNDTNWHSLGLGGPTGFCQIYSMAVYNGQLYVGGAFGSMGGVTSPGIACWNGTSWSAVGGGVSAPYVYCMCVYNGDLYVGGDFQFAGGIPASGIARWDGSQWHSVGTGVYGWPWSMVVDTIHNHLIIGGAIACYDTSMGIGICAWDGTNFLPIGHGLKYACYTTAIYNGYLFANSPIQPGMTQDTILVYWDSISWKPAAIGNSNISALRSYNNELYAGGFFDTIGGQAIPYVARYYNPSLSIAEPLLINKQLRIFPNPSSESVTISFSFVNVGESNLRLYNSSGKLILSKKVNESASTFKLVTGLLPKGVYLVAVQNKKEKLTEKFVVE